MRGSKSEITCICGCGRKRLVRTADIKRGWGKYFDKSCKAKHQESKTGQYKKLLTHSHETHEIHYGYSDEGDSEYWDNKD